MQRKMSIIRHSICNLFSVDSTVVIFSSKILSLLLWNKACNQKATLKKSWQWNSFDFSHVAVVHRNFKGDAECTSHLNTLNCTGTDVQKGVLALSRFVLLAKQNWSCPLTFGGRSCLESMKTFLYNFVEKVLNSNYFSHLVFKIVTFLEYKNLLLFRFCNK